LIAGEGADQHGEQRGRTEDGADRGLQLGGLVAGVVLAAEGAHLDRVAAEAEPRGGQAAVGTRGAHELELRLARLEIAGPEEGDRVLVVELVVGDGAAALPRR